MKTSSKFSLALLAGTILSTPANFAAAATLTPTLDTIKAEAADLSGSYELMELSGDLPEGAAEVEISGAKYYFMPTGDNAALLKTLAGTVAGNLTEDENGIFEFDGTKYNFDIAAIPESVFEYEAGTAEDYNFSMQEADAEGNLTTKYYKVVLKPETFATSENITWGTAEQTGDTTGSVAVNLPNNQTQTFYYAYTKPAGYTDAADRINNTLATANVTNVVFSGISSSSSGGAIYNTQNHEDIDIIADFIGNYTDSANGGAIYNRGAIGDITGDFIGNFAQSTNSFAHGGAVYNDASSSGTATIGTATIGDITGDFIGNYAQAADTALGGAIYNNATIGDITGDFIGNYAQSTNYNAGGGAIENTGTIGDITGDFIGNYAQGGTNAYSGAIYNFGSIGDITGDFIGNHADDGGAIYNHRFNGSTSIGAITGDFIGNYAQGDIYAEGGAVYNDASSSGTATIGDITGDFIGNFAQSTNSFAHGGAVYNDASSSGTATILRGLPPSATSPVILSGIML